MRVFNSFAEASRKTDANKDEVFIIDKIKYKWVPIMKDEKIDRWDLKIVEK